MLQVAIFPLLPPSSQGNCSVIKTRRVLVWGKPCIYYVVVYKQHWDYCWYLKVSGSISEVSLPAVAFMYWVPTLTKWG